MGYQNPIDLEKNPRIKAGSALYFPDPVDVPELPAMPERDLAGESSNNAALSALVGLLTAGLGRRGDFAGNTAAALAGGRKGNDARAAIDMDRWKNKRQEILQKYGADRQNFADNRQIQNDIAGVARFNAGLDQREEDRLTREEIAKLRLKLDETKEGNKLSASLAKGETERQKITAKERDGFLDDLADLPAASQQIRLKLAEQSGDLQRWQLSIPKKEDGTYDLGPLNNGDEGEALGKRREKRLADLWRVYRDPRATEEMKDWAGPQILNLYNALGIGDGTPLPAGGLLPMTPQQSESAAQGKKRLEIAEGQLGVSQKSQEERERAAKEREKDRDADRELRKIAPSVNFQGAQSEYQQLRQHYQKILGGDYGFVDEQSRKDAVNSTLRRLGQLEAKYPALGKGWSAGDRKADADSAAQARRMEFYRKEYGAAVKAGNKARVSELEKNFRKEFPKDPWFADRASGIKAPAGKAPVNESVRASRVGLAAIQKGDRKGFEEAKAYFLKMNPGKTFTHPETGKPLVYPTSKTGVSSSGFTNVPGIGRVKIER